MKRVNSKTKQVNLMFKRFPKCNSFTVKGKLNHKVASNVNESIFLKCCVRNASICSMLTVNFLRVLCVSHRLEMQLFLVELIGKQRRQNKHVDFQNLKLLQRLRVVTQD